MGAEEIVADIFEKFPFATILALVGLAIGICLPSGLDYFQSINWADVSNPQATITAAVIGIPIIMITETISGLVGMIFGGIIGLLIDIFRSSGDTSNV